MFAQICRTCVFSNILRYHSRRFSHKTLFYAKNVSSRKHIDLKRELYTQKRTIHYLWRKSSIQDLKLKDNVPSNWNLIYKHKMKNYLLSVQLVTTATATLLALVYLFNEATDIHNLEEVTQNVKHYDSDYFMFFTAFTVIVVVLQVFLSKTPIRIYNNAQKKEYKMIFYGSVPFTQNSCTFKVGDIYEYPGKSSLPWNNSAYILKMDENNQRKLYLLEAYFKRPADLFIMMGIQKDPDVEDKQVENE